MQHCSYQHCHGPIPSIDPSKVIKLIEMACSTTLHAYSDGLGRAGPSENSCSFWHVWSSNPDLCYVKHVRTLWSKASVLRMQKHFLLREQPTFSVHITNMFERFSVQKIATHESDSPPSLWKITGFCCWRVAEIPRPKSTGDLTLREANIYIYIFFSPPTDLLYIYIYMCVTYMYMFIVNICLYIYMSISYV